MPPAHRTGGAARRVLALICSCYLLAAGTSAFQNGRVAARARRHGRTSNDGVVGDVAPLGSPPRPVSSEMTTTTTTTTTTTSLSLAPNPLMTLGSPLASVSVLAFVVLIHEMGHFLAARSLGMRVKEFSVGVGPRVAGFRRSVASSSSGAADRKAEAGEGLVEDVIDFSLRALPLGGYVRFPENYNTTLAMQLDDEARERRRERRRAASEEKAAETSDGRSPVVAGSTVGGILGALTLGFTDRRREQKEEEERQRKAAAEEEARKKRRWNGAFAFLGNGKPTDGTKDASPVSDGDPPAIEYYDDPDLLQNRPWTQRAIVLSAGVVFNILLSFSCYFGEITVGKGLPSPVFEPGAVVTSVRDGVSSGLLNKGDIIVAVNGEKLSTSTTSNAAASQEAISNFISKIRRTPEGEYLSLSVLRTEGSSSEKPIDLTIQPQPLVDSVGNRGPQSIGVLLAPNYVRTDYIHASSAGDAVAKAGGAVTEITTETARSLFGFFGSILTGKGAPAGQTMSGPIGVIRAGANVVSSSDISAVIAFAAAISVNLAVVNALPLPGLDGGQLMFVLAEAVAGRKIDQRVQEGINAAALFMLLVFSFSTAVGDVGSMVSR